MVRHPCYARDNRMVVSTLYRLIFTAGIEPDKREVYGNTAIMLAAERGHAEVVTLLLHKHADVNRFMPGCTMSCVAVKNS